MADRITYVGLDGRVDALEHAQAGFGADDLADDGGAGMGKARIEAAAARPLHGFE